VGRSDPLDRQWPDWEQPEMVTGRNADRIPVLRAESARHARRLTRQGTDLLATARGCEARERFEWRRDRPPGPGTDLHESCVVVALEQCLARGPIHALSRDSLEDSLEPSSDHPLSPAGTLVQTPHQL